MQANLVSSSGANVRAGARRNAAVFKLAVRKFHGRSVLCVLPRAQASAVEPVNGTEPDVVPSSFVPSVQFAAVRGKAAQSGFSRKVVVDLATLGETDALDITSLGLSQETLTALEKKGITSLFPIQKFVFEPAIEGCDLVGRARTGSGKTLAFSLPVIESLMKENKSKPPKRGRLPRAIVLAPTRELAKQVEKEIVEVAPTLQCAIVYGGAALGPQKRQLASGVDIVVGTPGRVIDLINQGDLRLDHVRYSILDEADQMLDMGFEEDMETIIGKCPEERQTMLFSATLPQWVWKVASKYLKEPVLVDLVGEQNTGKLASSITPLAIKIQHDSKRSVLLDLLTTYGAHGKVIIFTKTKRDADEVAAAVGAHVPCEALHGDVPQKNREQTMQRFREDKCDILVATDVAARGLDIPNVELVVHFDLPDDPETFLHRSGRTGRAGNKGTTIAMVTPRDFRQFQQILNLTQTPIDFVGPPSPDQILQAASTRVVKRMSHVDLGVAKFFAPAAEQLLKSANPVQALATAMASMSGYEDVPKSRGVLGQDEGYITFKLEVTDNTDVNSPRVVSRLLSRLEKDSDMSLMDAIGKISCDYEYHEKARSAYFDIKIEDGEKLLQACQANGACGFTLTRVDIVPTWAFNVMPEDRDKRRGGGRFDRGGRSDNRGNWGDRRDNRGQGRDRDFGGRGGGSGGWSDFGGRGRDGGRSDRGGRGGSWGEKRSGGRDYGRDNNRGGSWDDSRNGGGARTGSWERRGRSSY